MHICSITGSNISKDINLIEHHAILIGTDHMLWLKRWLRQCAVQTLCTPWNYSTHISRLLLVSNARAPWWPSSCPNSPQYEILEGQLTSGYYAAFPDTWGKPYFLSHDICPSTFLGKPWTLFTCNMLHALEFSDLSHCSRKEITSDVIVLLQLFSVPLNVLSCVTLRKLSVCNQFDFSPVEDNPF